MLMHRAELTLAVSEVQNLSKFCHLLGMKPRRQNLSKFCQYMGIWAGFGEVKFF